MEEVEEHVEIDQAESMPVYGEHTHLLNSEST